MNLTLDVILDELAAYKPVVHKMSNPEAEFRRFCSSGTEITDAGSGWLYIVDGREHGVFGGERIPRHSVITGDTPSGALRDKMDAFDTLVQIPGGISVAALLRAGHAIFDSYDSWYQALLLAVIQRNPISRFLEIAAEKLTNPLALFDNNQAVIATAGEFLQSPRGTIWEKVNNPAYALADFLTSREHRDLARFALEKSGRPYTYHLSADPGHTYLSSHIWINDKLYGSIGMVAINAPFTSGQISIVRHIEPFPKLG